MSGKRERRPRGSAGQLSDELREILPLAVQELAWQEDPAFDEIVVAVLGEQLAGHDLEDSAVVERAVAAGRANHNRRSD